MDEKDEPVIMSANDMKAVTHNGAKTALYAAITEVNNVIGSSAKAGYYTAEVVIPNNVEINVIVEKFKRCGYKVEGVNGDVNKRLRFNWR